MRCLYTLKRSSFAQNPDFCLNSDFLVLDDFCRLSGSSLKVTTIAELHGIDAVATLPCDVICICAVSTVNSEKMKLRNPLGWNFNLNF